MAINPESQYPGKVAPATTEYPYGAARNITVPGDNTGTPWEAALVNDIFGFQQALLSDAGLVPSGTPEKATASQYLAALKAIFEPKRPAIRLSDNGGTYAALKTMLESGDYTDVDIDVDVVATESITPHTSVKMVYGNGVIDTQGGNVFDFTMVAEATANVSSYTTGPIDLNATTYVAAPVRFNVDSVVGFEAGKIVRVQGSTAQAYYARIIEVGATYIDTDTQLDFTIGTAASITQLEERDLTMSVRFTGSGTSDAAVKMQSCGVTLRADCDAAINVVSLTGAYNRVLNGFMRPVSNAIVAFNAGYNEIAGNIVSEFVQAVRCVKCHELYVHHNRLTGGTNALYGIGIEITTDGAASEDKNCRNTIEHNYVYAANLGVPGSGIGGIHLNFYARFNRIAWNVSQRNSFGIYLENNCSDNEIVHNNCSRNAGYYGVGISLDSECNDNTIAYNVCNYNIGATSAGDSCGIEVRLGPVQPVPEIDNLPHPCERNLIMGNRCIGNGRKAYSINGVDTVFQGNYGRGGGSSRFGEHGLFESRDSLRLVMGSGNNLDSTGAAQTRTIWIRGAQKLRVMPGSLYKCGGGQTECVKIEHGDYTTVDVKLALFDVVSAAAERCVSILGAVGNPITGLRVDNVTIDHSPNGFSALELNYVDTYRESADFIDSTQKVIANATNPI